MDRNVTVVVAVFASVVFSMLLIAVGVGSALEDMFRSDPRGQDADGSAFVGSTDSTSALRAEVEKLRRTVAERDAATPAAAGIDGDVADRLRYLERENSRLQRDVESLQGTIAGLSATVGRGGSEPSATPEPSGELRELLGTPEMRSVVEQLQRESTRAAEEVFTRMRRAEEEAELVASIAAHRENIEQRLPQFARGAMRRMDLPEATQEVVVQSLSQFQNQRADMRLLSFQQNWSDSRREQEETSLRQATVASLTAAGLSEQQAEQMVRMSNFTAAQGGGTAGVRMAAPLPQGGGDGRGNFRRRGE